MSGSCTQSKSPNPAFEADALTRVRQTRELGRPMRRTTAVTEWSLTPSGSLFSSRGPSLRRKNRPIRTGSIQRVSRHPSTAPRCHPSGTPRRAASVKQKARPSVEQKIRQRSSWAEGAGRLLRERVGESTGSGSLQASGRRCSRGYRPHAGRSGRNEDGAPMSWAAALPALAPLLHGAGGRHRSYDSHRSDTALLKGLEWAQKAGLGCKSKSAP